MKWKPAVEWTDLPDCELARMLRAKRLEHPTSASFEATAWSSALADLEHATGRDADLAAAAVFLGGELGELRRSAIPLTTRGFNRSRLVRLMVAFANQQYLTVRDQVLRKLKAQGRGVMNMDSAQNMLIEGAGGQRVLPDDLITYLVDSLPHWLFHIWQVADDAPSDETASAAGFAAQANQIVSVEHSLRQLWLNALWVGTRLEEDGATLVDVPIDRPLAERWFVFDQRQAMLIMTEHHIDAGAGIVAGGKLPPAEPAIPRTVIRMERPPSGNRKFVTGRTRGTKPEQRDHVSERNLLERLYVGLFLDETLPRSPSGDLTCRELCAAWWVMTDLAHLAITDLGNLGMADDRAIGRFSLALRRNDLAAIFADCLGIDALRANDIVSWLTCDPAATGRMFAKSFWAEPLVPDPCSDRLHLLLAPLLSGSPVKRVEAWMEKGGISDSRGIKGKGKPYERFVRRELAAAVAANAHLTDAFVAPNGLKSRGGSEEIDLLLRVGDAVVVGEVKCFVAPSEPTEKYNHLSNLAKATDQASTKRDWAERNRAAVATALDVSDPERVAALTFHPLVVLNHGIGIGLERDGAPVVDLHYLKLLLGERSFMADARFERGVGVTCSTVELYRDQDDLETRIGELLRNPPVLRRYDGAVRWRRVPFATSDGRPFLIEMPAAD